MNEWIIGALYIVVLFAMPFLAIASLAAKSTGQRDTAYVLLLIATALLIAWVAGVIAVAVTG